VKVLIRLVIRVLAAVREAVEPRLTPLHSPIAARDAGFGFRTRNIWRGRTSLTHVRVFSLVLLAALLAGCEVQPGVFSAGSGSPPAGTPPARTPPARTPPACPDPITCSTPSPGYTTPLGPPCDSPITTPDEIRAAAARMGAFSATPGTGVAPGEPILVHAMASGSSDVWLVPAPDDRGGASGVVAVSIGANGRGCAGMASGWAGPFPRISIDAARGRAAGPNDPVALIEAVYLPFTKSLPPGYGTEMVWRAVRQSGYEVFLFGSGDLYEGGYVRALLQDPLRGARSGSTPPPTPSFRPLYPTSTGDQVLAAARNDVFVIDYLRYLRGESGLSDALVADPRLDTPLHVVGLHKPYTVDLWVIPVRDRDGAIVSLIAVSDRDGSGQATEARAWSGPFPRVSESDAKRIASLASDPAILAQLGWAEAYYVSPGGPTAMSWLVTRRSGAQVVVTEDGAVVPPPR
jgi:hypothetical protein